MGILDCVCDCSCDCEQIVATKRICARCRAEQHDHVCAGRCFDPDNPCEIGMLIAVEASSAIGVTEDW